MHRRIAVERVVTPAKTIVSYIRLRGLWLRKLGFEPGTKVEINSLGIGRIELAAINAGSIRRFG